MGEEVEVELLVHQRLKILKISRSRPKKHNQQKVLPKHQRLKHLQPPRLLRLLVQSARLLATAWSLVRLNHLAAQHVAKLQPAAMSRELPPQLPLLYVPSPTQRIVASQPQRRQEQVAFSKRQYTQV